MLGSFMLKKARQFRRKNEGIIYYVESKNSSKWNKFIRLQIFSNGEIKPVEIEAIKLDNDQIERMRLIISENCFHYRWDVDEGSFYF